MLQAECQEDKVYFRPCRKCGKPCIAKFFLNQATAWSECAECRNKSLENSRGTGQRGPWMSEIKLPRS